MLLADTPAFQRAVPSKLVEYLACGLPVVTTDLPRQGGVVRDSGAGVVVPTGDDASVGAAVATALNRWVEHPEELRAARAAARVAGSTGTVARAPELYAAFADAVGEQL
jgi:glycosyltransferase involved in cell wall biosynthesis